MKGQLFQNRGMSPVAVARKPKSATLIIAVADWTGTSAVVNTGRLRVRAGSNVFVSVENKADADAYGAAGCFVSGVGTNVLNFVCDTTPTVDITINVVLL
jgi:hypothetical protein